MLVRSLRIPVPGNSLTTDFIGPFSIGDRVRSLLVSGRPTAPSDCSWLPFLASNKETVAQDGIQLSRGFIPVCVGAYIPFPLPVNWRVNDSTRYIGVTFDHSAHAAAEEYVVWVDVESLDN